MIPLNTVEFSGNQSTFALKSVAFFIWLSLFATFVHAQEDGWIKRLDKEGIKVFTTKAENSDLDVFRGTVEVESTLSAIVAVISDIGNYPLWMYKTEKASLIKTEGHTQYVYTVSSAPWPVKPRDNISMNQLKQNPDNLEILITMKAIPDYLPHKEEYIRIPEAMGFWNLTPLEKKMIRITFQMKSETGGNIPAKLANLSAVQAPYQTLSNLREEIKKPEYKFKRIMGIQEK
jgi:hypothetical protein